MPALPSGGLPALGCHATVVAWECASATPGSQVWRLDAGDSVLRLKLRWAAGEVSLAGERDRLVWVADRLGSSTEVPRIPKVVGYLADSDSSPDEPVEWLLATQVDGVAASDPRLRMGSVGPLLRGIGQGLRAFHDQVPAGECPFDLRAARLLESAQAALEAGTIRPDAGGPAYRRLSAADKVSYAGDVKPEEPPEELVVAHGAPHLENLLIDPATGKLVGLTDFGRLGVSDPHRDLAILVRSFVDVFGGEHAWRLLDAYGEPSARHPDRVDRGATGGPAPAAWHVDPQRLEFHALLDDLW